MRDSRVETLLVGGALDFATPPQVATGELLPHLPNGHQVVLPNLGHADDFWTYEPAASTRLVDSYLDSGASIRRSIRPTASTSRRRSRTRTAEIVLGVFLGVAALTLLSLLWIGRRVRRGATFGRKSSVPSARCSRSPSASAAGASARWSF